MTLDARFLIAVACLGCAAVSGVADPHAVGPRYDRWEAIIARPRSAVFDASLRVLTDSGFVLAQSNSDVGAISTADRKASSIDRRVREPGTMSGSDYPVRLSLLMTPQGPDSTRLSIMGQYRLENSGETGTVNVHSSEWRLVSGIGEAILAQLR